MMRHIRLSLALLLASLPAGAAQGEILLFERVVNFNRGVNSFDTDEFDLDLTFGDNFFAPTNGVTLFDSLVISPADVSNTYDATAVSDPNNFPTAALRVADGLNEFVVPTMTENQAGGQTEQRGGTEDLVFRQSDASRTARSIGGYRRSREHSYRRFCIPVDDVWAKRWRLWLPASRSMWI